MCDQFCLYEILQDVNTVLGIYIGSDMISWSLLNRDCEVLQWSYKCFPQNRFKENIHSLLQIVSITKNINIIIVLLYYYNLIKKPIV